MSAGKQFTYLWADRKKMIKPVECTAPEYFEYLFEWIFEEISDPDIFAQDGTSYSLKSHH